MTIEVLIDKLRKYSSYFHKGNAHHEFNRLLDEILEIHKSEQTEIKSSDVFVPLDEMTAVLRELERQKANDPIMTVIQENGDKKEMSYTEFSELLQNAERVGYNKGFAAASFCSSGCVGMI